MRSLSGFLTRWQNMLAISIVGFFVAVAVVETLSSTVAAKAGACPATAACAIIAKIKIIFRIVFIVTTYYSWVKSKYIFAE